MPYVQPKVEIGFSPTDAFSGPFFRLDDAVAGVLDNPDYFIGGVAFYDVTEWVRSIEITRGKPQRFANFPAASASIVFNNHDRNFDPEYTSSPFYGNIIPQRQIRISMGSALAFTGQVQDWNLSYLPNGDSLAQADIIDSTTILATQTLSASTPTIQSTGARVSAILDSVNWDSRLRDIESGTVSCGNQAIEENTNALSYLQNVSSTEAGVLFMSKEGNLTFRNRRQYPNTAGTLFFNQGEGIPYTGIGIVYGSELLFNSITIANEGGATATASDSNSIGTFGQRDYIQTGLLGETDGQSVELALFYADLYSRPQFRVETLDISVDGLESSEQAQIFALEIGDVCGVEFTPNNIGEPIVKYLQVIRISHSKMPNSHNMTFGFQEIKYFALTLDDSNFGRLDEDNVLIVGTSAWTLNDAIFGRLSAGMTVS